MKKLGFRRIVLVLALGGLLASLTGCLILLVGVTTVDLGAFVGIGLQAQAQVGQCDATRISEATTVSCEYAAGSPLNSLSVLISTFGVLGVFFDPLILQVPSGVSSVSASYDDGSGAKSLAVTQTDSFAADAFTTVTAEAGQTFLIIELPAEAESSVPSGPASSGAPFDFTLDFQVPDVRPVEVKAMLTVRADIAGQSFYLPQFPCVTDFASVPSVELPVPATGMDLLATLSSAYASAEACDSQFYDFTGIYLDLDTYLLWKVKSDTKPAGSHSVTDALGTRNVELTKTAFLGTPSNKDSEDPAAPSSPDHLVAYKTKLAKGETKPPKTEGVRVANTLGLQVVDLKKLDMLLVPAAKSLVGPVSAPVAPGVPHFQCWKARYSKGANKLSKDNRYNVIDQLSNANYQLTNPTRLCLPADKDNGSPGSEEGIASLMCFRAKALKPKPAKVEDIHVNDQIGPQILDAKKPAELCVASTVDLD